jgi:hypothetical protein
LDTLTLALIMSIGSAVAWLVALYSSRGPAFLILDVLFGMIGAALCALAITWIDIRFQVLGVVTAGPLCAALMILAGHAARRALTDPTDRRRR